MVLKYQTLKNEMENALKELELEVPRDARVGERATWTMLEYTRAYIKAVTKFAHGIAKDMTGRTTLKSVEIKIAAGAVKLADIERELNEERETA